MYITCTVEPRTVAEVFVLVIVFAVALQNLVFRLKSEYFSFLH